MGTGNEDGDPGKEAGGREKDYEYARYRSSLLFEAGLVSVCPEGATCFQLYVALWGLLLDHLCVCACVRVCVCVCVCVCACVRYRE